MREQLYRTVLSLASPDVTVIDTDAFFIRPVGSLILQDEQGHPLFHDAVHLSRHGAGRIQAAVDAAMGR